jgi:hypothetical protein
MEDNKSVTQWIEEWCNLYPENVEFNGYKLKSDVKYCVKKMQTFCKQHPAYTKDVIFAATKLYLTQQAAKGWEYTKQSTYFISKLGQPSLLESFCEKIAAGNTVAKIDDDYTPEPISDFI